MDIYGIAAASYMTGGRKAEKIQRETAGGDFASRLDRAEKVQRRSHIVYMKTDDMLYSGGNGTGLSFYLKYAENSTEEKPMIEAKGVDENGQEFEQVIDINNINPGYATIVEMRALEAYLGVEKQAGFSSLPLSCGDMGLQERKNFIEMFKKQSMI